MSDTPWKKQRAIEKASAKMRKDIETGRRGFIVSPSAEVNGASGPLSIPAKQGEGLAAAARDLWLKTSFIPLADGFDPTALKESRQRVDAALANLTEQDEVCERCSGGIVWIGGPSYLNSSFGPCPSCSPESPPTAPPLDEWQPIEDAPDHGQFVATDGRRAVIVDWRDGRWACTYGGGIEPRQITHFKPIGNLPNGEKEN